jgi:hypothetical protein
MPTKFWLENLAKKIPPKRRKRKREDNIKPDLRYIRDVKEWTTFNWLGIRANGKLSDYGDRSFITSGKLLDRMSN